MEKFTDLGIRALPPGTHYDSRTPGFGIRVGKHRKTWLVLKGPRNKRIQTILGHYPALTLADARRKALVALGSPFEDRSAPTFPEALDAYLAQGKWKASSRKMLEWSIRRHFKWTKTLDKITHQDVAEVLDAIEATSERSHALSYVRAFLNWCVPRYIPHSPCTGIKVAPGGKRSRILSDDELKRIWKAAEQIGHPFGTIVQLLMVTGQRRGEIVALQPQWVHDDRIILPAPVVKNGRDHAFPIGPFAKSLIRLPLTHAGWSKSKQRLDKLSGVENYVLHDLRRSLVSRWADFASLPTIERYINHVSGSFAGIVGVYQHNTLWADQVRAVEEWERCLTALLGASP